MDEETPSPDAAECGVPTRLDARDAHVRFEGVQKTYDGVHLVVHGLDLSVARGEFLTLLGPSGSGKTTTLMMLAGFEQATAGEIFVNGQRMTHVPAHRRGIGMVFQNYALFPHMTVAQNVAFPLEMRGLKRAEVAQRVARALDMVRLPDLGERRPQQLSGGQQQRIALARALVFEPQLVLMDEPLGALDKQLREHLQYEIRSLHERLGVTMVYVTHDQGEALTMSDRIAVFSEGRIQQLASPKTLYESPANAFVAAFIGENNRLSGTLAELSGESCRVRLANGEVVRASRGDVESATERVVVSLRPERVRVAEGAAGSDVVLAARMDDRTYHGDHIRCRLLVDGLGELIARLPNNRQLTLPLRGETVAVGWDAMDGRALRIA